MQRSLKKYLKVFINRNEFGRRLLNLEYRENNDRLKWLNVTF